MPIYEIIESVFVMRQRLFKNLQISIPPADCRQKDSKPLLFKHMGDLFDVIDSSRNNMARSGLLQRSGLSEL